MPQEISYNIEARDALKRGVDKLANAVKVTLGPKGRNVILERKFGSQHVTKDGVSVAEAINLVDPIENIGAQMVKEVASKTADIAGDGTTTATVLAQAIVTHAFKNITAGANPMDLKRGIDKAVAKVVENLQKQSHVIGDDFEKIKHIACISANNDNQIGELIAQAMEKVGKDGIITVEEATGTETTVTTVDGMQFYRGFISSYFINKPETLSAEYEDCDILLYNGSLSNLKEVLPILEQMIKTNGKPILIIANEVEGECLSSLVKNKMQAGIKIVAVRTPGRGDIGKEMLEDLAILTGGKVITEEVGSNLEKATLAHIGRASKIIVDKDSTTIVGGAGNKGSIADRILQIKSQIQITKSPFDKEQLGIRLAKLSGGIAVLHVGAASEVEMKEKKDRIDDALHATRAAVQEGIVAGGGVAFIRAIASLDKVKGDNADENTGIQIIRTAIEAPLRQICDNAAVEGSIVINKIVEGKADFGYNARTGVYEDLIAAGVIDPTKVARVALENAASLATMMLISEAVVYEVSPTTSN